LLGYNILLAETKVDCRIALMALQHHERPDGRGYPWGIANDKIHPLARIVAVADVYDALITDRVYRSRIPAHEALAIINAGAGTQFDSQVVAAVKQNRRSLLYRQRRQIRQRHSRGQCCGLTARSRPVPSYGRVKESSTSSTSVICG
jgi:HD-GYP domain-containing protein (c-di-GMP phosphodiesterase class II)